MNDTPLHDFEEWLPEKWAATSGSSRKSSPNPNVLSALGRLGSLLFGNPVMLVRGLFWQGSVD